MPRDRLVIAGHLPGWDGRLIAQVVLKALDSWDEDTTLWSDDHLADFAEANNISVREIPGLWTYQLEIYQDGEHIADLIEHY